MNASVNPKQLTQGHLLVKNSLWNTLGLVLPLVVGFFSIPFLVHGLGTERFGVLTIAWMVIGYFSIFDFGLGRALTQLVAAKLGHNDGDSSAPLVRTGLTMMLATAVIPVTMLALLADNIVFAWLNIDRNIQPESLTSFYLLTASIPFVIITAGLRGVLEAYQRFAVINLIRIPLGLLTFLGPLAILPFSHSLDIIVLMLLFGRIIGAIAYFIKCRKVLPDLGTGGIERAHIAPLLRFGSWMTLTNLIGPLMVYFDRFIIGATLTMTAVSYYVAPYEVITKLWMIPMGLIGVLFPALSGMLVLEKERAARYVSMASNLILFSMFPIFLIIVLYASEGLNLWLGQDFSANSTAVLQLLAIGVFVNCSSRVAYMAMQSVGRPDILAKIMILELPFYLILLWYALNEYGIEGAALTWTIRVVIDAGAFFLFAGRLIPEVKQSMASVTVILSICVFLLFLAMGIDNQWMKIAIVIAGTCGSVMSCWLYGLSDRTKSFVIASISVLRRRL